MTYRVLLPEVMANVVLIAFLGALVAKLNEAVFGRIYSMLFAMFNVSPEAQERWRMSLFLWAIALGVALCMYANIGFMTSIVPAPGANVLAGLLVGCGAGFLWDVVLDPVPDGAVPLDEPEPYYFISESDLPPCE